MKENTNKLQDINTGLQINEALRYDSGKCKLHHIHPSFWQDYLSANNCPVLLYRLNQAMDGWFYFQAPFNKSILDELPPKELSVMVQVLEFGSRKYDSLNYTKGMAYSRVLNSFRRHLLDLLKDPTKLDKESKLPTKGHVYCNFMFAYLYTKIGAGTDDRPNLS